MKNILNQLQIKKEKILQQIGELGDFRKGSLSPRYRKCGKPYSIVQEKIILGIVPTEL